MNRQKSAGMALGVLVAMLSASLAADVEWPSDFWDKVAEGRPNVERQASAAELLDSSVCGTGSAVTDDFDSRFMDAVMSPGVNLNCRPPTGEVIIIK